MKRGNFLLNLMKKCKNQWVTCHNQRSFSLYFLASPLHSVKRKFAPQENRKTLVFCIIFVHFSTERLKIEVYINEQQSKALKQQSAPQTHAISHAKLSLFQWNFWTHCIHFSSNFVTRLSRHSKMEFPCHAWFFRPFGSYFHTRSSYFSR